MIILGAPTRLIRDMKRDAYVDEKDPPPDIYSLGGMAQIKQHPPTPNPKGMLEGPALSALSHHLMISSHKKFTSTDLHQTLATMAAPVIINPFLCQNDIR